MDNSMLEKYKEQALEMMRAARAKNPDYSTSSRSYFPSSMTRTDGRENFDDMEQDGNYINKNNQNTAVRRQNTITEDVNMPGQCFNDMNASVQTMNMMNKDEMMQSMRSGDMNSSVQSPDMSDQDIMMQPMRSRDMNSSVQSPGMSDQDIMMQPMRSRDMNSSVQGRNMMDSGSMMQDRNMMDPDSMMQDRNMMNPDNMMQGRNMMDSGSMMQGRNMMNPDSMMQDRNMMNPDNMMQGRNMMDSGSMMQGRNMMDSGSMMQGRNMMNQGNMMQEQNIMPVQDNSQNGNIFEPGGTGKLIVNVTTLRKLFPVVGADVTVFTGTYEDMDIIDTSRTDESGKSKVFSLAAPSKSMSLDPDENGNPYKPYNVLVVADGYIPNIHMNIPIFDSITSLQNSDLVYISASGGNPTPRITDESSSYTL